MGLDMYLEKIDKIGDYTFEELMKFNNSIYDDEAILPEDIISAIKRTHQYGVEWKSISDEVGYWRKANQIHNWFVQNVQNGIDECEPHLVTKEKLEELLFGVTKVLALGETVGEDIFPPSEGFFFGSAEYDSYYYEMVEHTKEVITKVLDTTDFDKEIIFYRSSW